ncbi:hypothetical protein evm_012031 [Chilo suppressalis]|nr:hypothetical protein evm_012031 [Chilo suppressalis]
MKPGVRKEELKWLARSAAIVEVKQLSQWSVIGWVTENLLSRAPPCFGRHVKPLVPAASAVVSTHQSALGPRGGVLSKAPKSITTSTPTSDTAKDIRSLPLKGRPPKHKRVEEVVKGDVISDDDSVSSGGGKRWRGSESERGNENKDANSEPSNELPSSMKNQEEQDLKPRTKESQSRRSVSNAVMSSEPRAHLARHIAELDLPADPTTWTEKEVVMVVGRVCGAGAGAAAAAAGLRGPSLLMASRAELARALRLRLGPAVKVTYA